MDGHEYNKCIALKTGYMTGGKCFCERGKIYSYRMINECKQYYMSSHPITLINENGNSHSMSIKFFKEYFEEVINVEYFPKESFEIK